MTTVISDKYLESILEDVFIKCSMSQISVSFSSKTWEYGERRHLSTHNNVKYKISFTYLSLRSKYFLIAKPWWKHSY